MQFLWTALFVLATSAQLSQPVQAKGEDGSLAASSILNRAERKLQMVDNLSFRSTSKEVSLRHKMGFLSSIFGKDLQDLAKRSGADDDVGAAYTNLLALMDEKATMAKFSSLPLAAAEGWTKQFGSEMDNLLNALRNMGEVPPAPVRRAKAVPTPIKPRLMKPKEPLVEPREPLARKLPAIFPPQGMESFVDESRLKELGKGNLGKDVLALADRNQIGTYREILALEGLAEFKKFATDLIIDWAFRRVEGHKGHPALHCAFVGSPGTGKTTVARLYAKLLYELGYLGKTEKGPKFTEVSRSDLVGAHIGETEKKTNEHINASMGGMLFVDEAHNLNSGGDDSKDFGHRALNVINKVMEDQRARLVIVFAGYREQMQDLLDADPGLSSRFTRIIAFEDFSPEQLRKVLGDMYDGKGYRYLPDVLERAGYLLEVQKQQEKQNFGNARSARNLLERSLYNQRRRLFSNYHGQIDLTTPEERREIIPDDLG